MTLIDPLVVELLEIGRRGFEPREPGETFRVGDGEVYLVGHEDQGVISVETIERGSSNGVDLVTSDAEVLQIYLALWGSGTWRGRRGLAWLVNSRLVPATQYVVLDEGGSLRTVRRADGTGLAHQIGRFKAGKFAVALAFPLDVVVAAIKHPTGAPVWDLDWEPPIRSGTVGVRGGRPGAPGVDGAQVTWIDPLVVELVAIGGMQLRPPSGGETFRLGDGEVFLVGHEDQGVISVEWISRGS